MLARLYELGCASQKGIDMHNNKNRMKDRPKTNPELRKIDPHANSDKGIIDGNKIGVHGKREKSN